MYRQGKDQPRTGVLYIVAAVAAWLVVIWCQHQQSRRLEASFTELTSMSQLQLQRQAEQARVSTSSYGRRGKEELFGTPSMACAAVCHSHRIHRAPAPPPPPSFTPSFEVRGSSTSDVYESSSRSRRAVC